MRGLIFGSITPLPWLLPGMIVSAIVAALVAVPLGRVLRARPVVAWALVASFGLIVSATLTPLRWIDYPGWEPRIGCSFARVGIAPLLDMRWENDAVLNILLFIPFGLALAVLPRSRAKVLLITGAIALPFVIELTQMVVTPLGRGCESDDVIDNLTGLVFGFVGGSVVVWILGLMFRGQQSPEGSQP